MSLTDELAIGIVITEEIAFLGGDVPGPLSARPRFRLAVSSFFITAFPLLFTALCDTLTIEVSLRNWYRGLAP